MLAGDSQHYMENTRTSELDTSNVDVEGHDAEVRPCSLSLIIVVLTNFER